MRSIEKHYFVLADELAGVTRPVQVLFAVSYDHIEKLVKTLQHAVELSILFEVDPYWPVNAFV
jgi:hypothetical protein